ncbi:MAG: lysophospholipid acyltransferase family protein, partial [Acetobacteraceae bacterium]
MTTRPDPLRRRSGVLLWLFGWYLRWYFYWRFHAVRISLAGLPAAAPGRPLIIYANHPSWWDPATFILAGTKLFPGRQGFGPMDSAALGRYRVLERMGVFGVPQNDRRSGAIFLRHSLAALARPNAMLWITAEGAFTDHRARPVRLRPGLAHLVRRVPEAVILPLAMEYGFWNESRPEALLRFGPPVAPGGCSTVAQWTQRLEAALTETMDALAAEAMTRNPSLFRPLLRGGAGVGGIYDMYRRVRALLTRQRFDPSHEGRR